MAWCPQCKNEYRKGIKVCADCGCELIEDEQYDDLVPLIFGEEEKLNLLKKYLEYNKLKGVTVKFDEEDHVYVLYVRDKDKGNATAMGKVFLEQEYLRQQEEQLQEDSLEEIQESDDNALTKEEAKDQTSSTYSNSLERAEDNRSSAWTLLLVGCVGMIGMILCLVGVIPLSLGNPYLFYGVMCTVFLLFIVMGFVSMKNAKIFAKKAESENTLRDAMTKWYQENLDGAAIDKELVGEEEIPEEILYFNRVQKMKDLFNHQFMNLDQVFLEHFIDEEVYDFVFSDTEE